MSYYGIIADIKMKNKRSGCENETYKEKIDKLIVGTGDDSIRVRI